MLRLVEELLDVSRITAGRLALDRERVDLVALVREVVGRYPEPERKSPITVQADGALVGPWDRLRLEQVVSNLVGNALKYGDGKPIEVEVEHADHHAILRVRDHGIGISADDQQRIFERYERAVADRNVGGLGLGLWIVRQVVEAHGGRISVESEPGNGATFVVEIPTRS
jgi:signal transduction histidine kinase